MTWLPYRRSEDSSALLHYITGERLLGDQEDKYYTYWYDGPQVSITGSKYPGSRWGFICTEIAFFESPRVTNQRLGSSSMGQ